jgi:Cu(I)/Ag(I) efflux system membrane fusion protein
MSKTTLVGVGIGLLALGFVLGRMSGPRPSGSEHAAHLGMETAKKAEVWTCSMHPQIRQPKPGRCPICGMDLIPVAGSPAASEAGPPQITLSESARKLAQVETAPVERRFADVTVRMVGKVQFDETRVAYVTARVPGRIDRLHANVTGVAVKQGEHLADLYSPEVLSAQQELIQAARAARDAGAEERAAALALVEAGREKLRLWGFTSEQIAEVERSREPRDRLTFYAPIGGVVVAKDVFEGQYVEMGTRLYTLADLSQVWVMLDAYESDLAWLRYGQEVEFRVEAWPGEVFRGTVAVIAPVLDPTTRTAKVRVNAVNPDGRIKPEMFVHADVRVRMAEGGVLAPPGLRGKWVCSMHPEVVAGGPGACRVCQMPLVPAAELGYVGDAAPGRAPLVIPASAPLVTGERAVVYVAVPGEEGRFEGRQVVLGVRAGDVYVVRDGLREGEQVVVRGSFTLDSSLQIQGRPSMMNPAAQGEEGRRAE